MDFIKLKYIPILKELWENDMDYRMKNNLNKKQFHETCIDQSWKTLQNDKWYITRPKLGKQIESYSDIENRNVNYNV